MDLRFEQGRTGASEGARRATGEAPAGSRDPEVPDPAVEAKPARRRFTAAYKLDILKRAELAKATEGGIGALLRGEGLYSSHLTSWRRERDQAGRAGLAARRRGSKGRAVADPRVKQLQRENARLKRRNQQLETMVEVQKKLSEILGIPLNPPENDENA